jgi:hypothetical protein
MASVRTGGRITKANAHRNDILRGRYIQRDFGMLWYFPSRRPCLSTGTVTTESLCSSLVKDWLARWSAAERLRSLLGSNCSSCSLSLYIGHILWDEGIERAPR